jgi:hypothetical protein
MSDYQSMLVNAAVIVDDIEKIEFKSELLRDPGKAQQYAQDRQDKLTEETLQVKRGNFQKAYYDMGRYMDMDHHARFYDRRNTDLANAQNNIIQLASANTTSMRFDTDNTRRQFLINEWYAQNKLESLFFLQVAFLAMVAALLVIMLGKMNLFPFLFGKYLIFIVAAAAAITGVYRFNYTKYTRDVQFWNKRKFGENPLAMKANDLCASATAAAAGVGAAANKGIGMATGYQIDVTPAALATSFSAGPPGSTTAGAGASTAASTNTSVSATQAQAFFANMGM